MRAEQLKKRREAVEFLRGKGLEVRVINGTSLSVSTNGFTKKSLKKILTESRVCNPKFWPNANTWKEKDKPERIIVWVKFIPYKPS